MVQPQAVADLLGGRRTIGREIVTTADLEAAVNEGLKRRALDNIVEFVAPVAERSRLRNQIVPRASYQRQKRLSVAHSAATERIARIAALARWVWEDDEKARAFLRTAHPELGGRTPLEAAMSELGARLVEEVIERGVHGLPV